MPREHRRERGSQARRAGGADRELEAVGVEHERGRHPALEVVSRRRLAERDVRLPEQVVELDVEARDPHACADAERVREDARAAVPVDGDHVRRVLAAFVGRLERGDEREDALLRRTVPRARGSRGSSSGNAREPASRRDAAPAVRHEHRFAPARPVVAKLVRRQHDAVDREQRLGEGAAVDARRALLGQRLEAVDEPRLLEELAGREHPPVPA